MPVSKNQIKLITSLSLKKFRDESGLFAAEGTKLVKDLSEAYESTLFIVTDNWLLENKPIATGKLEVISNEEFRKISNQKNPQGVFAVFKKPVYKVDINSLKSQLSLVLDEVQDPGNLGTIIRIADWFGIKNVICSENCADAFSPKSVQASMGALARVHVHYVNLLVFLKEVPAEIPVYGTFLDGIDIYREELTENGIIVMGNEGNGISPEIEKLVTGRLLIPNFPMDEVTSESLNVSVATAIICAEFRRRIQ
jgi:TrmH family RNA methyltransferase